MVEPEGTKRRLIRCDWQECRRLFTTYKPEQRFCSQLCRVRYHNARRKELAELGKRVAAHGGYTDGA